MLVTGNVERIWRSLPGYDRENVDEWLSRVVPLVEVGKRASASLTEGYLARAMERQPLGLPGDVDTRNGTRLEAAYQRPFVTVWTALGAGSLYTDAVDSGLARALEMARFDIQGAMRATAQAVQEADPAVIGFERTADGDACAFCLEVDGAFVRSADAMSLHPGCGCSLSPVTAETRGVRKQTERANPNVAIHQHGEMGPVLTAADHNFTSEAVALG